MEALQQQLDAALAAAASHDLLGGKEGGEAVLRDAHVFEQHAKIKVGAHRSDSFSHSSNYVFEVFEVFEVHKCACCSLQVLSSVFKVGIPFLHRFSGATLWTRGCSHAGQPWLRVMARVRKLHRRWLRGCRRWHVLKRQRCSCDAVSCWRA